MILMIIFTVDGLINQLITRGPHPVGYGFYPNINGSYSENP